MRPLSRETSLYLDTVRFIAARAVFFGDFAAHDLSGGLFWRIAPFRHDAVIVFFVLSGFVISHAVTKSEHDVRTYFINRAARIYSVVVPAIGITFRCTDLIGGWVDPNYFAWSIRRDRCGSNSSAASPSPINSGPRRSSPAPNGPYWSLGYEVPYYAIFACALFARGLWRFVLPALLLLAAGPTIAALFHSGCSVSPSTA